MDKMRTGYRVDFAITGTSVDPRGGGIDGSGDREDLLDAIELCDDEIDAIKDYTGVVANVRALTILSLYERDVAANGQDGAVRRINEVVGVNVRPALAKARALREKSAK